MILEVIFKMRSSCFESQLGTLNTSQVTRWPCLYFFLPHSVHFMRWNWSLLPRFLCCNGRTCFIPTLITMLDFILKMFSLCAPISQILFQTSFKDCSPSKSPYKSCDWISWQQLLQCCWLIFVVLKVKKFAQIRNPCLLLNNQPNLHPHTTVENLTVVGQKNLTVLPKALCKTKWSYIFFRLLKSLHNLLSILIIFLNSPYFLKGQK